MSFPSKYKTVKELEEAIEFRIENQIDGCYRILTPKEEECNEAYDNKQYVKYSKLKGEIFLLKLEIKSLYQMKEDLLLSDEERKYRSEKTPQF